GTTAGQIALAGAASSGGVLVTARGTAFSTVTASDGSFGLGAIPTGTHALDATRPPGWVAASAAAVAVSAGATTTVPVMTLQPLTSAAISGTASLELQSDASGTAVSLAGTDFRGVAVTASTTTSASGAW